MDEEDLFADYEPPAVDGSTAYLMPQTMGPQQRQPRAAKPVWDPHKAAGGRADLSGFMTIDQFYDDPRYKAAPYSEKKQLEKNYQQRFLTKPVTMALGGNIDDLNDGLEYFKSKAAVDERKNDSMFDTDLWDKAAMGLARGVGGTARVLGEAFDSDLLRALSEKAAEDVKRIEKEGLSATTRYKDAEAQAADRRLAEEFGGKENVPWYREIRKGFSDFMDQPVNMLADAVGTSLPVLVAAGTTGPLGAVAASSALVAGDAGGGAYDAIKALPEKTLANNPRYQLMLEAGLDPASAHERLASEAALEGGAYGAVIGAISGTASARAGAASIVAKKFAGVGLNAAEKKVADVAEHGILSKLRAVGVEAASEGLEEGITQMGQNKAVQTVDPSQSLTEDAVRSATVGALAGAGLAGVAHALPSNQAPQALTPPQPGDTDGTQPTDPSPPADVPPAGPPQDPEIQPGDTAPPDAGSPPEPGGAGEPGSGGGDVDGERDGGGQPPGGPDPGDPTAPPVEPPAPEPPAPPVDAGDLVQQAGELQQILDMPEGEARDNALASFPDRDRVQAEVDRAQGELRAAQDTLRRSATADAVINDVNGLLLDQQDMSRPYGGHLNGAIADFVSDHLQNGMMKEVPKERRNAIRNAFERGELISEKGKLFSDWTKSDFQGELGNQLLGDRLGKFADYVAQAATPKQLFDFHSAVNGSSNEDMQFVADTLREKLKQQSDESKVDDNSLAGTQPKSATTLRNKLLSTIGGSKDPLYGDKSEPISDATKAAIERGDGWAALKDIALNNKNKNYRLMASKMLSLKDLVTVALIDIQSRRPGVLGLHYGGRKDVDVDFPEVAHNPKAKYGVVLIDSADPTVRVFLHEMAHAYTRFSYADPKTAAQKKARNDIDSLYARALKVAIERGLMGKESVLGAQIRYAFTNQIEFIAEVYGNPLFQEFLASVPDRAIGKSNLLTRFIKVVADLFGVDNLLSRTLLTIDRLVDEKQNETSILGSEGTQNSTTENIGVAAVQGSEVWGGDQERGTDGRREQDHRGVSTADQAASAVARETGTAHGNGNPYTEGPPSPGVADSVAKLPDKDRVALEQAASTVGLTAADLAQAAYQTAEEFGADYARAAFSFNPATAAAMMKIPMPPAVKNAVNDFLNRDGRISTWDELINLSNTGEVPTSNRFKGWQDRAIERFIDSSQPFAIMLRKAGGILADNPLWRLFKLSGSRYETQKVELNKDIYRVNKLLTQLAKQSGLNPKDFFRLADMYTLAKYVATGANTELLAKHQAFISQVEAQIAVIKSQMNASNNPKRQQELQDQMDRLEASKMPSENWVARFNQVDNVVRKPEGTLLPNGAPDPDARTGEDKFVGGMTTAEAEMFIDGKMIKQNLAAMDAAQQAIVGLQQAWAKKAVGAKLFNPDETAQWSSNPNYVPTTGENDAESDLYKTGGITARDFVRTGRASVADGGFMATIQQASSFARRIAFKEFYDALAQVGRNVNNPYGITTMAADRPSPGAISFATKRWDSNSGTTIQEKIVFDDQAAAGSILGMNRQQDDNIIWRAMSDFTSIFGRAVTQYTLAFGPINYVRDLGEKAFTLLSSINGIDKAKFISAVARSIFSPADLYAAWKFSAGQTLNTPSFQLLKQLSDAGGLNTRTGSLSRDVDRIVKEMRRTDGWREVAHRIGDVVHNYNNMFEIAASLAVYRALGQSTDGTVEEGAFRILNTMNFGQSGTKSPFFRAFYTFFNPTAQGALNVARGIKSLQTAQGRGVLIGTALAYGFLYALARSFSGDDEDDQTGNRMDSLADASLARSIPLFLGDDSVVKLPVPFGLQTALWATIVASGRLASGRFDAGDAAAFALQGAAEQMAPFPLSRVDITKDPAFWMMKSLTPQWGQLALNLAADKNDFGSKLTRAFIQGDQPLSMQSKRGTPDAYKDAAVGVFKATGIDLAPEKLQETVKFLALGPLGQAIDGFVKDEERSGIPTELAVAQGLTGSNRLLSIDTKEVDRSYYESMERVYALYKRAHADAPREKENGRYEPLQDWLDKTNLSDAQQQLIMRFSEADKALKKARRGGATTAEERDIMRSYLRDTKDLK